LQASRGGLCRALARMANQAAPTYSGLVQAARQSLVNSVDETGWKVGGRLRWLHVAVSAEVTVYAIRPGRGYEQSREILGADYPGFLVHDGWAPYYRFAKAFHQSCLNHLRERCQQMAQIASPTAATFPLAVRDLLEVGLRLRDRYQQEEISEHGLRTATGRLEAKLDRRLEKSYRHPANRRLARHLEHERPWLFSFLYCPGLDATNHAAERAIRGMVIARKVSGVNYFSLSATIRIPYQRQLHLVSSCLWLWCFSQPAPASSLCLLGFACSLAAPGAKPCDARRAERLGRSAGSGQRAATFPWPNHFAFNSVCLGQHRMLSLTPARRHFPATRAHWSWRARAEAGPSENLCSICTPLKAAGKHRAKTG